MSHTGTIQKPKAVGGIISIIVITFILIGILISRNLPEETSETGTVTSIVEELFAEEREEKPMHPTERKWRMCWRETKTARKDPLLAGIPCSDKSVDILVDFKEYNSIGIIFSASWRERDGFRERAVFRWDKISSDYGTWHQDGSARKEKGHWDIKMVNNELFIGQVTSETTGKMYPMTLHAL